MLHKYPYIGGPRDKDSVTCTRDQWSRGIVVPIPRQQYWDAIRSEPISPTAMTSTFETHYYRPGVLTVTTQAVYFLDYQWSIPWLLKYGFDIERDRFRHEYRIRVLVSQDSRLGLESL